MHLIFQANIRRKLTKEEKLAYIREVREERGKYQSRASVKQKKVRSLLRFRFALLLSTLF